MAWHSITGSGATTQMWFQLGGPGKPEFGVWRSLSGLDVDEVLGTDGPDAVDTSFWFERNRSNRGTKLVDFLWPSSVYGFKVLSERFADVLLEHEPRLRTWPADVRGRDEEAVLGYVLVLEPVGEADAAVHSYFSDRRVNHMVVSDEVCAAVKAAKLTGLRIVAEEHPFPGDHL